MVDRKKVTDDTGTIGLVMTYSTSGFKLKQEETGAIYGKECMDTIAGYDENNIPYSRFTYVETDKKDEDEPSEQSEVEQKAETDLTVKDTLEMLGELGVDTDD